MISLSVEPGTEPGTFRFQSKVLAGFLLHHFPLCVPPPLSSSLSLSLSLSVLLLSFLFHLFSCFSFSLLLLLAEKLTQKKKNTSSPEELVGFYNSTRGLPLFFPLEWSEGGLLKQRWVFFFSFTYRPTHRNGLRGPSPQALTLFGGVGFIARRLRCPEKGNADGVRGIFGTASRVGLRPCDRTHLKNGLVPYSYAGGA